MKDTKQNEVVKAAETWESPDKLIKAAEKKYLAMKVIDKEDTAGYDMVKDGLKEIVGYRTGIDKKRKQIKRTVDDESKRLLLKLAPIEEHLKSQKMIRDKWLEAEKKRKEDEEKERIEKENKRLAEENAEKDKELEKLRAKLAATETTKNEAESLFSDTPDKEEIPLKHVYGTLSGGGVKCDGNEESSLTDDLDKQSLINYRECISICNLPILVDDKETELHLHQLREKTIEVIDNALLKL